MTEEKNPVVIDFKKPNEYSYHVSQLENLKKLE